jgi:arginyl-tRNA--protein-N-Asp/Glu arginylyltransferase
MLQVLNFAYSYRCDARNFQLSKSQKKVLKRMNKYLVEGLPLTEKSTCKIEDVEAGSHHNGDDS